jgi:hypothetical protein
MPGLEPLHFRGIAGLEPLQFPSPPYAAFLEMFGNGVLKVKQDCLAAYGLSMSRSKIS